MSVLRGILFLLAMHSLASPALAQIYPKEYIKNLRTKANDGDPKSQYGLAIYFLNENKPKEAWNWLNKSAENGYAEAQFKMGDYYEDGLLIGYGQLNVAIDLDRALDWYKRAADQNHLLATENICALRSRGPAQNLSEAITYCRASSQRGRHNGYFYLGKAYQTGEQGIAQDPAKASLIYQELAEKGYAPAIELLANLETENSINSQDYNLSFSALQKAIYLKPEIYLVPLAKHYENGWGTNKDFSEAHRLYFFGAVMGNLEAKAWLVAHPQTSVENIIANLIDRGDLPEGSVKLGAYDGSVDFYPARALDAEIQGEAVLSCRINYGGKVDNCVVDEETPPNIGFGMATLKVISARGIESDTEALKPYAGKIFQFRYRWVLN